MAAVLVVALALGWFFGSRPRPEPIASRAPAPRSITSAPPRRSVAEHGQQAQPPDQVAVGAAPQTSAATPIAMDTVRATLPDERSDAAGPSDAPMEEGAISGSLAAVGGKRLDRTNWQEADAKLPEPVLNRVKRGEYAFTIVSVDVEQFRENTSPSFRAASAANAERYQLAPATCGLVDRATGTHPDFYFGYPFPSVGRRDPNAGCQIMWNVEAAGAMAGGRVATPEVVSLGGEAELRLSLRSEVLDFVGRHFGPTSNPRNLRSSRMTMVQNPFDLKGLSWLTSRPMDGGAPDQTWQYLPSIRRVRKLSEAQRGDPLLGIQLSLDDYGCFAGRLEAFVWKVIGFQDVLAPIVSATPLAQRLVDQPRVEVDLPELRAAFETKDTGLAPWLIVTGLQLTTRPAWIIEGTPRSPQYPVGRIVLYVDREFYRPYWKLTYERTALSSHAFCGQYWSRSADGNFTAPGTNPLVLATERGEAALVRQRNEVLAQDLHDDWFTITTMISHGHSQ